MTIYLYTYPMKNSNISKVNRCHTINKTYHENFFKIYWKGRRDKYLLKNVFFILYPIGDFLWPPKSLTLGIIYRTLLCFWIGCKISSEQFSIWLFWNLPQRMICTRMYVLAEQYSSLVHACKLETWHFKFKLIKICWKFKTTVAGVLSHFMFPLYSRKSYSSFFSQINMHFEVGVTFKTKPIIFIAINTILFRIVFTRGNEKEGKFCVDKMLNIL